MYILIILYAFSYLHVDLMNDQCLVPVRLLLLLCGPDEYLLQQYLMNIYNNYESKLRILHAPVGLEAFSHLHVHLMNIYSHNITTRSQNLALTSTTPQAFSYLHVNLINDQ